MAAILNESILLKKLKVYQWIFSLYGLNLPPFLIYRPKRDFKYFIVFMMYLLYSGLLLGFCARAIYAHNKVVFHATVTHQLDSITEIISYVQNSAQLVLLLIMEYKSWCCHQKLLDILQMIFKLESNLLQVCAEMFQQEQLKRRLLQTTGFFLVLLSVIFIYINWYLIAANMELRDKIFVTFFLLCMQMKFLEYGIYVQLISEYLLMLLKSLKCLKGNVASETLRKQPLAWAYVRKLRQNKKSLNEVWYLIYQLERYFAWPIFLLFFYNGLSILATVNWAYVHYVYETREVFQTFRVTNISLIFLNMLLLCYLTQNCIQEYQKTSHVLLNFKLYPHDQHMSMAIKEYSLQLIHQSVRFSCNGYMDIDLSYFGSVTLAICTYTVILVQFKLTDVSEGVMRATQSIFQRI